MEQVVHPVIEAARAALEERSLSEVVDLVKRMIPVTRMIQTADTLKYLYMGGRIGQAKRLVGTLLRIKPLIGMDDGVIVALGEDQEIRRQVGPDTRVLDLEGRLAIRDS